MRTAVLVCLLWQSGAAQPPGTFTRAGDLITPRIFHTATLLPNGKVLIAGGNSLNRPTATAELYDPATATFKGTGDMTATRFGHTATLLPNGKVLIAGGLTVGEGGLLLPQATAEVYDPATGTFSATGSMTVPRNRHLATLLHNGKVLVVGGSKPVLAVFGEWPPYRSAELYDPTTETFTATGDMVEPGAETATLLPDGKVLMTKCVAYCYQSGKPGHAELYEPSSGTFAATGDLADKLQGLEPVAVLLLNGKVLIAGGDLGDFGGSSSAEIYDPGAGVFAKIGDLTADIDFGAATLLPDGWVFLSGESYSLANHPIPGATGATELYDAISARFGEPIPSRPLFGHVVTLLPDGTVLQSGGCCQDASAEVYHPAVLVPSPVLFSRSGDDGGPGAILHAGTTRLVSPGDPAIAGEFLEIYGAGLTDGGAIPPQVAIGGLSAEVLYFGKAPGYAALNQINVRVPPGVIPGVAVGVRINYLSRPSNEVTIAVR